MHRLCYCSHKLVLFWSSSVAHSRRLPPSCVEFTMRLSWCYAGGWSSHLRCIVHIVTATVSPTASLSTTSVDRMQCSNCCRFVSSTQSDLHTRGVRQRRLSGWCMHNRSGATCHETFQRVCIGWRRFDIGNALSCTVDCILAAVVTWYFRHRVLGTV